MDYWYWDGQAVFVCDGYLAWFNDRGRVVGPGGRTIRQPFADYLSFGPWVDAVPARVVEQLTAAVAAKHGGAPGPTTAPGPHPDRPAVGTRTDWEYFGPYGVRVEGDHLLWYENEGPVRFASGGASEQTFADFLRNGPHMENVPAVVAVEVAAAVLARVGAED